MGKKDKKKGKGAEKTAAKTEKKAINKMKKELAAKGEDDIERLIAEFQEKDKKFNEVTEETCPPPSPRSGFTLCAHPEREKLILFGGEYFNGSKTFMYNDLYFYNIKKDQWSILHSANKPPPRCAHQAIIVPHHGGQMWIFGGEFASPTRSNFHHYKDFWVFHLAEQCWEQVKASGGPTSRSGHRMVVNHKQIIVFGGFHESIRDYKYFNDVFIFDLENYAWSKVEPVGRSPTPRSGCQFVPLIDGKILLYGGYCREKVKKDVDKGVTHTDMFYLQSEEKGSISKWKWIPVKQSGIHPTARCGFSMTLASGNRAFAFGGVHDEEDSEESLVGVFHNDMYALELDKGRWLPIVFHKRMEKTSKKRHRKTKGDGQQDNEVKSKDENDDDTETMIEELNISEEDTVNQMQVTTSEDSVFTVRIGPQASSTSNSDSCSSFMVTEEPDVFVPCPRMNTCMVVKNSVLYMYGGLYEDGDKQLTLSDFYSIDLHKLDEWKPIIPLNVETQEWIESEEGESDESDSDSSDETGMDMT